VSQPRNVLITGAGSGIGAAVAKVFAAAGDQVHLVDLARERLESVAAEIGDRATAHVVDVTQYEVCRALVGKLTDGQGAIDVLVSNAGVFDGCAGVQDTSPELWNKVIGINLTGTFNIVKPVSEAMVRQGSGRIISVGSIAAQRAMPDGLAYCASKAALEGLVRRLAFDLGGHGITANVVAPGVVKTGIRATSTEILGDLVPDTNVGVGTSSDLMDLLIPAKRGGEPSEIAETIHFLASRGAAYINGEVIHVDGGWIAS
jgi:3-oxoacyl-[acyl-carrier protein] reductase